MYLKCSTKKKTGKTHLSICHNYHEGGTSHTKTILTLGYLDELEKEYEDPKAHFKALAAEMEAERKASLVSVDITIHPAQKIKIGTDTRKNLGFSVLSCIYHGLGIGRFWKSRQTHRKLEYSLDAICRLLIFNRILDPGSKQHDFAGKGGYFERFDFSDDDIYRSLDIFDHYKDDLIAHLHTRIRNERGRDTSLIYYDVTNYYFEIDTPDDLRKKGVSKEHRPNPIVQMGLLMDTEALPISFDLFPGNENDCTTLLPQLKKVRTRFETGRVIVVADKALCTSDNLAVLSSEDNYGYVISASVRKGSAELKKWVKNETGYIAKGDDYKVKSRIAERILKLEDTSNGNKRTIKFPITQKQVAFYSAKYDRRAKAERAPAVAKARALVAKGSSLERMLDKTAAKYINGISYDKDTGEILEVAKVLTFDEKRLAEEESFDGYYVICSSEMERTDDEIIEMYRGLWRIEESFKITKSELKARPVWLSREDHIRAHFLICFISLLIIRLLHQALEGVYPIGQMLASLRRASATNLEDNWWIFDYRDEALDDMARICGIDLSRKYLRSTDIRSLVASTKKPRLKSLGTLSGQ